jgi:hypothetical protein
VPEMFYRICLFRKNKIVWVYSLRLSVIKGPLFWEIVVQIILKAIQRHCSMKMKLGCWGRYFMVFNAPFNNISVISWRSVLLVGETGENNRPAASHWQPLSHNVVSSTPKEEFFIVSVILVVRLKFVVLKIIFVKMTWELS